MDQFLHKGITAIQEATLAETAAAESGGSYEPAIQKYMQGLEYFNYARKRGSKTQHMPCGFLTF